MRLKTKAIHAGEDRQLYRSAVMPPIYMTSTFVQEHPGEGDYEYTRAGNPNFTILEKTLASMENAQFATVFSSGLGALTALLGSFSSGDRVVALDGLYGGTFRLFNKVFRQFGVELDIIRQEEIWTDFSHRLKGAKMLCFETPTNPLLDIYDIEAFAGLAHKAGALCLVDNTFATPILQNPISLGADLVWHSTTKYIGGHSDTIGGAMMTNSEELKQKLDFGRMAMGVNPSPFDCWLTTRGVKTLAVRMKQHEENAAALVDFFQNQPYINKMYYPGLKTNANYKLALKQMRGFGGMISLDLKLSFETIKEIIGKMEYVRLAESLGGVESLICHPATMTHASLPPKERKRLGISDSLVRISVGIEDAQDLIDDFRETFKMINS